MWGALQAFKDPAFPRDRLVELLKLVAAKGGATELADVLQLVTKGEAHGRWINGKTHTHIYIHIHMRMSMIMIIIIMMMMMINLLP